MKHLWAPWRIKYITQKQSRVCIFCKAYKSKKDEKNFVLFRSKYCFVMLNIFPYNNGHIMVAPNRHISKIELLTKEEALDIFSVVTKAVKILQKTIRPHGFNIGINLGEVSGAGIKNHLHIHIVPRWLGDTNFMPVISDTKVISQSLEQLYTLFKKNI